MTVVNVDTGEIVQYGELVPLPSPDALDLCDDPGSQIIRLCQQANEWLAAASHVSIEQIVQTKAEAAALAAFSRQRQLGQDAELSALEVQRRAERGIGLAVRRGQDQGLIARSGDNNRIGVRHSELLSPHVAVKAKSRRELTENYYALADGVTDQAFEVAIEEAKSEGNLSRTNLVRKVKPPTRAAKPKPAKSSKKTARDKFLQGTRHHDYTRIARETVHALDGLAMGVALIDDYMQVQVDGEWAASLTNSLRALNRFSKQIKETTHVHIEA